MTRPVLQGLHFIWSVGAALGPVVLQPFMRDDPIVLTSSDTFEHNRSSLIITESTDATSEETTRVPSHDMQYSRRELIYGYLCIGAIMLFGSIIFLLSYFIDQKPVFQNKKNKQNEADNKSVVTNSDPFFYLLMTLLSVMFFCSLLLELVLTSFVALYAVRSVGWPNHTSALLTSVLWGSGAMGRLISIPLSMHAPPEMMLMINCTLMGTGFSLILLLVDTYSVVLWIAMILIGFGCATTFPTTLLYAAKYVSVEGKAMSCFLTIGGLGAVLGPLLVGYLFDVCSEAWLIYISLSSTIIFVILLGASYRIATKHPKEVIKVSEDMKIEPLL